MTRQRLIPSITALGLLLILFGIAGPSRAAVFNVSTVAELQTALTTAQANGEADTINIAAGVYQPSASITFQAVENHMITLLGAGAGQTVFDGSSITGYDWVLDIDNAGSGISVSGFTVASSGGGGMGLRGNAQVTITDSEISDNAAGGLYTFSPEGDITVERCVFSGNIFDGGHGAGLYGHTMKSYYLRNSVFLNNQATGAFTGAGGGFYGIFDPTTAENIDIVNNTFIGNTSATQGGGIYLGMWGSSATVNIHNNIIRGNTAEEGGNDGDDLWVDPADVVFNLFNNDLGDNADTSSGHSEDLEITNTANYIHAGNIAVDPQLGVGAHLAANSPCVDAGNDGAPRLPAFDFEGDPRIVGDHVDMGADEYAPLVVVVATVSEFRDALFDAENNGRDDVIHVAPGIYAPGTPLLYLAQPTEDNSLRIVGGGDGVTVLDGGGVTSLLELFADMPSPGLRTDLVVEDISFINGATTAPFGGAALVAVNGNGNVAVNRCSFNNNTSLSDGAGAVYVRTTAGGVEIRRSLFLFNSTMSVTGEGGGLLVVSDFGPIFLVNSVFFNNMAGFGGGGASLLTGEAPVGVINSTLLGNVAAAAEPTGVGGGLKVTLFGDNAIGSFYNSIFWDNASNANGDDLFVFSDWDGNGVGALVDLAHSVIGPNADLLAGVGEDLMITHPDNYASWACLQQDPLLGIDFHLDQASVCIDAGDDFAPMLPPTDFEGEARIGGAAVDIGADEYHIPPFFADGFESGDTSVWSSTVP